MNKSHGETSPILTIDPGFQWDIQVRLLSVVDGVILFPISTPWKINMEHNHGGLEDDFPL